MHPNVLARGAPLRKIGIKRGFASPAPQENMAIGIVLGVALIVAGLVLLSHLSYTNLGEKPDVQEDMESASVTEDSSNKSKHNDCFLPFCFFQVARVTNHESWIVACLMSGATVLVLSMV